MGDVPLLVIRLERSVYAQACAPTHVIGSKDPQAWATKQLTEQEFKLRDPVELHFCWD